MASDKATQYPANGFSFRGLTSYLANNNNTQTNNDFSRPVAGSSAADRPRAPAALGERESVNGYLLTTAMSAEIATATKCALWGSAGP